MNAAEEIRAAIDKLATLRGRWLVDKGNLLFVTLHATIDAQLAILRNGLRWAELDRDGKVPDFAADDELALARAINAIDNQADATYPRPVRVTLAPFAWKKDA